MTVMLSTVPAVVPDGVPKETGSGNARDREAGIDGLDGPSVGVIGRGATGGQGGDTENGENSQNQRFCDAFHARWTERRQDYSSFISRADAPGAAPELCSTGSEPEPVEGREGVFAGYPGTERRG